MDIASLVSHLQAASSSIIGVFVLTAVGDDALDLLVYVRTAKKRPGVQELLGVVVQDVGTKAFAAVALTGFIAGIATGNDPLHAGLAAAAVAAGVSTLAIKADFSAKLAKAFPSLFGSPTPTP